MVVKLQFSCLKFWRPPSSKIAIPFFGASPLRRYCPPILQNDDRIHRYILPRTTVFPQYVALTALLYKIRIPTSTSSFNLIYLFQMNFNKKSTQTITYLGVNKLFSYLITKLSCISKNLVVTATPSVVRNRN